MRQDEIEDSVKEAQKLSGVFAAIADIWMLLVEADGMK